MSCFFKVHGKTWSNAYCRDGLELLMCCFFNTIAFQTLAGLPEQDSYYDMVDCLEEQGIEVMAQRHLSRKGTDLDLVEQFNIYEVRKANVCRVISPRPAGVTWLLKNARGTRHPATKCSLWRPPLSSWLSDTRTETMKPSCPPASARTADGPAWAPQTRGEAWRGDAAGDTHCRIAGATPPPQHPPAALTLTQAASCPSVVDVLKTLARGEDGGMEKWMTFRKKERNPCIQ